MHRRTARGNRIGLAVVGLLLVLAGAALFAAYEGYYGSGSKNHPLYPAAARHFVHDNGSWLWPVIAAAAVVVGVVFLRWLLVQLRTDRLGSIVLDSEEPATGGSDAAGTGAPAPAGRTDLPAHAVTDVAEDSIIALRGVQRVSATVSGNPDAPQLWLRITTDADADIARVRSGVVDDVLRDVRTCLDLDELPTYVRLVVSRRDRDRNLREVH